MRQRALIVCLLIPLTLLFSSPAVLAQTKAPVVSYYGRNVSIAKVLDEIVHQTGYSYMYAEDDAMLDNLVNLNVHQIHLDTVLKMLFHAFPLDYSIDGTLINITRRKASAYVDSVSSDPYVTVTGEVIDEQDEPIEAATVSVAGTAKRAVTDHSGHFRLSVKKGATLIISNVSMETKQIKIQDHTVLTIRLKSNYSWIGKFSVVGKVNNGYIKTHKLKTTGSFELIDRPLLDRNTSSYIYDHIENLTTGLIINHGGQSGDGSSIPNPMLIRGLSTINANASPLMIVDNFPYDGDVRNINPNDVENISILKDAAATAIWGARAGNGVIVLTTRRGMTPVPKIVYQTVSTFQQRPDIYNMRTMSSGDFIDREKDLFKRGYYDDILNGAASGYAPITPVVELLEAVRNHSLDSATADRRIDAFKRYDVRDDIGRYFYRDRLSQQHSLQVSGSSPGMNYFFSLNWDHDPSSLVRSSYDRISLRSQNSFKVSERMTLDAGINVAEGMSHSGSNPGYNYVSPHGFKSFYPYASFVGSEGSPQALNMDYSPEYNSATTQAGFPDWNYRPLKDIGTESDKITTRDYLFNAGLQYKIGNNLTADLKYQFENQLIDGKDVHNDSSYFTRNLINQFIQVDPSTGALSYPIPAGGILDASSNEILSHQGRAQLNYTSYRSPFSVLSAMAGAEIRSLVTTTNTSRYYGYEGNNASSNPDLDYTDTYFQYLTNTGWAIPNPQYLSRLTDHFLSYYSSASYLFRKKYFLSASARFDGANLFGARTNERWVPLWSAGFGWEMSNEPWYRLHWLSFLKLKSSYGSSGNIARQASAYTTAQYFNSGFAVSPYPSGVVLSPPNKNLRWEQVRMFNLGLEFGTTGNMLSGGIEYYIKNSSDLVAQSLVDPTLGYTVNLGKPSVYYENSASMSGHGLDLQLESHNLRGRLNWTTHFSFSHAISKVSHYGLPPDEGYQYLGQNSINPIEGRPVYAIYSFPWKGLDPLNGNPQGLFGGKTSTSYSDIINSTALDSMVYSGPSQPTSWGALRNSFSWRHFTLSCNISYKLGYYFRKPSIIYSGITKTWTGNADYSRRWKQTGDEHSTDVPSDIYPSDYDRDKFYTYSSALVRRADHIRFEDVQCSYEWTRQEFPHLPFAHLRVFLYCSNLGLLWTANKDGIDPYFINVPKDRKKISMGVNIQF